MNSKITNNIMVLDDDPFMLKLMAHMLESEGCTSVTTCANGRDALEMVDSPRGRPELIFLDLNLPGMDGMEFARHLVERKYEGHLVLMSGEDDHLLRASTKLAQTHHISVVGSFHKPITPEKLRSMLDIVAFPHQAEALESNETRTADELRAALANGGLSNYYQPKVSLSTGAVMGVEALVRWRRRIGDELVSPYKFLGIAEAFGLIHDLTRVVLNDALMQAKAWHEAGISLPVAVNVSEYNIESLDFADMASQLAGEIGVEPRHITFEVSEGWLPLNDLGLVLETLTRLHLKRFRLALDEFGTGFSNITQLRNLPFDELKIDRSFVHHVSTDAKIKAKFVTGLAVARQLDLDAVGVGVEAIEDWHVLRLTGCDYAQGSLIADPMPAEELPGWIRDWEARIHKDQYLFSDLDLSEARHL